MSIPYTSVMNDELMTEDEGDVFFIERGDGFVFACGEREAWNTLRNQSNWQRRDFKIIGTSDGKTYREVIAKTKGEKIKIQADLAEIKTKLERYNEAEEKMLYEDLISEDDPKLQRVRTLKEQTQKEMAPIQARLKDFSTQIVSEAFAAELEVARLTPRMPRNHDVEIGSSSQGKKDEVLQAMGRQVRK